MLKGDPKISNRFINQRFLSPKLGGMRRIVCTLSYEAELDNKTKTSMCWPKSMFSLPYTRPLLLTSSSHLVFQLAKTALKDVAHESLNN